MADNEINVNLEVFTFTPTDQSTAKIAIASQKEGKRVAPGSIYDSLI